MSLNVARTDVPEPSNADVLELVPAPAPALGTRPDKLVNFAYSRQNLRPVHMTMAFICPLWSECKIIRESFNR